ncbi:hypothetical protein [Saccharothrix syringae]|uniref:Uncharacterized protein n=1 Tax=Saccharothrix syringae TaxID=103733 RepID=A0A5Q0H556_SACSY|nr:hypothetical protein [Saccharothrix syringae]QFZ21113.1 hypothetical protein EKG83_30340 [Saccharothrix syringae]
MTIGTLTGLCVALFIAAAALFHQFGRSATGPRVGRVLRWLAFAGTVGIAVAALPEALADSSVVVALLAVPVVLGLLVVVADAAGRAVGPVTAIAAALMLGWGVFLAMAFTPYFVFPALVLGVAAVASVRPRRVAGGRSA